MMTPLAEGSPKSHARSYLSRLSQLIASTDADEIDDGVEVIRKAWHDGRQILTMGNGGSAMTALHFITDWNKGVFSVHRPAVPGPFADRQHGHDLGLRQRRVLRRRVRRATCATSRRRATS